MLLKVAQSNLGQVGKIKIVFRQTHYCMITSQIYELLGINELPYF